MGAQTSEQAHAAIVTELEGRGAENEFDPLMACNWMIHSKALNVLGLGIMAPQPDGSELCPVCEVLKADEKWWIDGPADAMLQEAREKGLVPNDTQK